METQSIDCVNQTFHAHILETGTDSYRLRASRTRRAKKTT
jgi:hypothetical protein